MDNIELIEVEPGSSNDPFSRNYNASSGDTQSGALASGAADGHQVQSNMTTASTATGQTPQSQAAPPAAKPDETPALTPDKVEAMLNERLSKAVRSMQSASDKKIAALEKQLSDAQEARLKADRDAKLNSDELSDEEKDILRDKYALEDEKSKLKQQIEANEKYHRELAIATLSKDFGQFGVTADELDAIDDVDAMEKFAKDKELDFYRSGKTLAQAIAAAPVETVGSTVPAGATAPSHVGGEAPAAKPYEFDTKVGRNSLLANMLNLPDSVIRPN